MQSMEGFWDYVLYLSRFYTEGGRYYDDLMTAVTRLSNVHVFSGDNFSVVVVCRMKYVMLMPMAETSQIKDFASKVPNVLFISLIK